MILRPYGLVIEGRLELGLELVVSGGEIEEIRPHTGVPELHVISPAFVNAHSHLEYRGFQDSLDEPEYWSWIRELTRRKGEQTADQVREDCLRAAKENRAAGIAIIGEHSDRPFAGQALAQERLQGVIFQEVITFNEHQSPAEKLQKVRGNADENAKSHQGPVWLSPHAYHTVDRGTLAELGASGQPLSIHVAETEHESAFTREGTGPIADFYRFSKVPFEPTGKGIVASLIDLGIMRTGSQLVHCCALEDGDIELLAESRVTVAHCPRSNTRLKCPSAPVREMLDSGIAVGLGLDSPASGGPIDMFAEMREALRVSCERGRPLQAEEAWLMATSYGYGSLAPTLGQQARGRWEIQKGSQIPLIKIHVRDARSTEELIDRANPGLVEWV